VAGWAGPACLGGAEEGRGGGELGLGEKREEEAQFEQCCFTISQGFVEFES
jgi:hypothetical protein